MSNKLALYEDASCAFNPAFDREQRQHYFDRVYDNLKSGWGIGRAGELASAQKVFEILDGCQDLHCRSAVTLMNFNTGNLDVAATALQACKEVKRQTSGEYPFVSVSKFLHACNPKLYVIYDRAEIDSSTTGVYKAFGREWKPFYDRLKGTYSALVPSSMVFMFEWSLSYLHWASYLMQNGYDGLMEDFANWARSEDGLQATNSKSCELNQCYATALDCIIIGAKYLELGK